MSLFGRTPQTRIIDLFMDNPLFEFSRMEMIKALGMAKITMYRTLPSIEAAGIIRPTRKIGKTQMYRLNPESSSVRHLRGIIREISMRTAERELQNPSTARLDEEKVLVTE